MSFDASWLDLREPADRAARDPGLLAAAADWLGEGAAVDLGCGTGSTVRAFGSDPARWRLVDHDPALLALAPARCPGARTTAADLRDIAALPVEGARLVTASALCDLVSRAWLEALADRLAEEGAAFYAALNYDGAMDWAPPATGDAAATAAFNRHQRGDKGFGPALGPEAGAATAEVFAARGYVVARAASPWRLGPAAAALQRELAAGVAAAAAEAGFAGAADWGQARRTASGAASCTVGHSDVLATPGAPSAQSKITSAPRP